MAGSLLVDACTFLLGSQPQSTFSRPPEPSVLSGHNGEHGDLDAIEFIEATPGTGLGEALEYRSQRLVIHLVAGVKNIDGQSKAS